MKRCLLFSWLLALPAFGIIDANENGISDLMERKWLVDGSLLPAGTDVLADEGGGWNLTQIATAGLSPKDATNGVLRVTIQYVHATFITSPTGGPPEILTPEAAVLTWPTLAHKKYVLQLSEDLGAGSWARIAEVEGSGGSISQTIALTQPDGTIPGRLFFRVSVEDLDEDSDLLTAAEEAELGSSDETAYSDGDFLSDYYEATVTHSNPALTSTAGNGVQDDELTLPTDEGADPWRYAPVLSWDCATRQVIYSYHHRLLYPGGPVDSLASSPPEVILHSSWGPTTRRTLPDPLSAAQVSTLLNSELPFPGERSSGGFISGLYGIPYESYNVVWDPTNHIEHALIDQASYRLVLSAPSLTSIYHRSLMTVTLDYPNLPIIEAHEFFVGAGKVLSAPELLNPGDRMDVYAPEFFAVWPDPAIVPQSAADPTADLLQVAVGVGDTTSARITMGAVDPDTRERLEVVAVGGPTFVQLGDVDPDLPEFTFTISGVKATASPEKIVLRLKLQPNVIFATMLVDVLPRRNVGVTAYRVYDSRIAASEEYGGIPAGGLLNDAIRFTLNQTYRGQGNIAFQLKQPDSVLVDIGTPGAPKLFNDNGSFPVNQAKVKALSDILRQRQDSSKYNIAVVRKVEDQTAITIPANHCSIISASATERIYPHELGHGLGLATNGNQLNGWHDMGPWPSIWAFAGPPLWGQLPTALMYLETSPATTLWIRAKDWIKANSEAANLE